MYFFLQSVFVTFRMVHGIISDSYPKEHHLVILDNADAIYYLSCEFNFLILIILISYLKYQ